MMWQQFTFSTQLTLVRMIVSPLVLPFLFVYLLPFNIFWLNCMLSFLFLLLGATDFFDGYFARKYEQVTFLGAMLDPVADKFLLYSALIGLLAAGKIYFFWAILLIGREFFVMGLRQLALEHNFALNVSQFGKIKTALQFAALAFIIANPYQAMGFLKSWWNAGEFTLLAAATGISLFSAKNYFDIFMGQFKGKVTEFKD